MYPFKHLTGISFILLLLFCFSACDSQIAKQADEKKEELVENTKDLKETIKEPEKPRINYAKKYIDEVLYPDGDFENLSLDDQRYDYAVVDLNDDGKYETMFTLINMDYCGSGGCTLFLLNSEGSFMGRVTVMDVPVGIAKSKTNGWHNLYVSSKRQDVMLQFGEGEYTTNASMAKKVSKEAREAGTEQVVLTKFAF